MTLTLYTTSSERERMGKTLTQQVQVTGTLRGQDNGNKRSPTITVEANASNRATILACNYAYISEYDRYYFIGPMKPVTDKLIEIPLTCDVLETFKTGISNNMMILDRTELYNSQYVVDNSRAAENFPMVLTRSFSAGFNSPHYYLTVASSIEGS